MTEIVTKAKGIWFIAPFAPAHMAVRAAGSVTDAEFEHAMALYREAVNSNTPVYRFLCFYKITF